MKFLTRVVLIISAAILSVYLFAGIGLLANVYMNERATVVQVGTAQPTTEQPWNESSNITSLFPPHHTWFTWLIDVQTIKNLRSDDYVPVDLGIVALLIAATVIPVVALRPRSAGLKKA